MTPEEQNKTLASLHFIYGALHGLTLVGLLLLVFVFWIAASGANLVSTFWIAVGIVAFLILLVWVGLLPLVVGYGLRKQRRWVKPAALALGVISLVNIPIGTALGIYTFRFFKSKGGIELYGGKASPTRDGEMPDTLRGAQPPMNLG